jgi:DNA-3-methyladenine glycosylase II
MSTETPLTITLPAAQPFDFRHTLGFLCGFPATRGEQHTTDTEMVKALRVSGRTAVARVTATAGGVQADLHSASPLPEPALSAAADRVSFFLSLDDDLTEFYATGRKDPSFAPVLDKLYGYHQVKFPSPLENLVWSLLDTVARLYGRTVNEKELFVMAQPYGRYQGYWGHYLRAAG